MENNLEEFKIVVLSIDTHLYMCNFIIVLTDT